MPLTGTCSALTRKQPKPACSTGGHATTLRPLRGEKTYPTGRIDGGLAHLPDQEPYQARNGDGSPRVFLNPSLNIAFHSSKLVLRGRGGLRQAISGRTHDACHLVSGRGNLLLSEIGDRLGQLCDVLAQTGHVGNRTGIRHIFRRFLRAAPSWLRATRDLIVRASHLGRFVVGR